MSNPSKYKRRIKIIKPRLQLKLVGVFVGLAALSVLLQSVLLANRLTNLSVNVPVGGQYLVDAMPSIISEILIFTFGLVLPLIFAVGVLITHRIAGPIYRFEEHLKDVAEDRAAGPCRIRVGDELQDLCDAINNAVKHLQAKAEDKPGGQGDPHPLRQVG
jgi:signal transduction histidine kinase